MYIRKFIKLTTEGKYGHDRTSRVGDNIQVQLLLRTLTPVMQTFIGSDTSQGPQTVWGCKGHHKNFFIIRQHITAVQAAQQRDPTHEVNLAHKVQKLSHTDCTAVVHCDIAVLADDEQFSSLLELS